MRKTTTSRRTCPHDRLTEAEASQARELVDKLGGQKAARRLGIADENTLYKAIARVQVSRLTAFVVRAHLPDRTI